jgi:hypothetical protein
VRTCVAYASLHLVSDNSGFDEKLVFELPEFDLASDLAMRLAQRWPCSIQEDLGAAVVTVFLLPDGDGELAQILRRVESWVAYRSLGAIRYWLDNRVYILEAGYLAERFTPAR